MLIHTFHSERSGGNNEIITITGRNIFRRRSRWRRRRPCARSLIWTLRVVVDIAQKTRSLYPRCPKWSSLQTVLHNTCENTECKNPSNKRYTLQSRF